MWYPVDSPVGVPLCIEAGAYSGQCILGRRLGLQRVGGGPSWHPVHTTSLLGISPVQSLVLDFGCTPRILLHLPRTPVRGCYPVGGYAHCWQWLGEHVPLCRFVRVQSVAWYGVQFLSVGGTLLTPRTGILHPG